MCSVVRLFEALIFLFQIDGYGCRCSIAERMFASFWSVLTRYLSAARVLSRFSSIGRLRSCVTSPRRRELDKVRSATAYLLIVLDFSAVVAILADIVNLVLGRCRCTQNNASLKPSGGLSFMRPIVRISTRIWSTTAFIK